MSRREKLLRCLDAPTGMNRVYFGGHQISMFCSDLGIKYGQDSIAEAVKSASDETIDKLYDRHGAQIESVWEHGLASGAVEESPTIWVRLGEYRTSPPADKTGWAEYVPR